MEEFSILQYLVDNAKGAVQGKQEEAPVVTT